MYVSLSVYFLAFRVSASFAQWFSLSRLLAYVLVLADLPQNKSKISPATYARNRELAGKFKVRGFPCGIVCGSDGTELGRIGGYVKGGPKAYFGEMEKIRAKAPAAAK